MRINNFFVTDMVSRKGKMLLTILPAKKQTVIGLKKSDSFCSNHVIKLELIIYSYALACKKVQVTAICNDTKPHIIPFSQFKEGKTFTCNDNNSV